MNKATTKKHQQIIYKSKTKNKTPALKTEDLEPSEKTLATSLMSMPRPTWWGREPTTTSCPLTSTCVHVHTYT